MIMAAASYSMKNRSYTTSAWKNKWKVFLMEAEIEEGTYIDWVRLSGMKSVRHGPGLSKLEHFAEKGTARNWI